MSLLEEKKHAVHQFIDPVQLAKDSHYSPLDLTGAMMVQASLFAHYGTLAAKASAQAERFKMLLETAESKADKNLRNEKAKAGEKATEAQIKAEIALMGPIIALKLALNEARMIENICKSAVETFRHRRDMLIQHGLISREEMKGELAIAGKNAREQELQMSKDRVLARRQARMDGQSEE